MRPILSGFVQYVRSSQRSPAEPSPMTCRTRRSCLLGILMSVPLFVACGGDGSTPTAASPTPTTLSTPTDFCFAPGSLCGVLITPSNRTVAVGAAVQLTAELRGGGSPSGDLIPGTSAWSSDAPNVAKVDPVSGIVTGVAAGSATISATVTVAGRGSKTGRATVAVGVPTPYDGTWQGTGGKYGPFFVFVQFGTVTGWKMSNIVIPLAGGGTCVVEYSATVEAPIVNGSFSGGGLSGRFASTSSLTGQFPSFNVGAMVQCNASGLFAVSGGSFQATK